jgi:hypothetical protein
MMRKKFRMLRKKPTHCEFETGVARVVTQILSMQVKELENG